MSVVVVGQIGRDLALRGPQLPQAGESASVVERREMLGGKGANQAVGLAQLGAPVALFGVVGDDSAGSSVLSQASRDGIDTAHVVQRGATALMIYVVDEQADRLLFEYVPPDAMVSVDDVEKASAAIDMADTVSLQLQQPPATMLAAARRARRAGARVVADGTVESSVRTELLRSVDVLRADAKEAELIAGEPVCTPSQAAALAKDLLGCGPELVALALSGVGDLVAWRGGSELFPLSEVPVVDRTGAGDAFMAGLIAALRHGADPAQAGSVATAAASSTVQHLGGRPDLAGVSPHPARTGF